MRNLKLVHIKMKLEIVFINNLIPRLLLRSLASTNSFAQALIIAESEKMPGNEIVIIYIGN